MFKCRVCDAELPDGTTDCPHCLIHQEPPAKFAPGTLVKMVVDDKVYYNYVTDSYFNQSIQKRMYRMNERIAMAIWREDWLEPVSDDEVARITATGLLEVRSNGGWNHPIMEGVNK